MNASKYLIIGNSTAAVAAVEAIRAQDSVGTVTMVSDEPHFTYSRPCISYLLEGKTTLEKMRYRRDSFYEEMNVRTLFGLRAEKIDTKQKTVTLADGSIESYEKLLLATGSVPFVPPTDGCPAVNTGKGAYTFIKLDDALALARDVTSDSHVVVIGGGLTGIKAVEGLLHHTKNITVVEFAPRVLPVALDEKASEIVQNRLTDAGVSLRCGHVVKKVLTDSEGKVSSVMIGNPQDANDSGVEPPCDVLVISIGVRPNLSLVKDTEIQAAQRSGIVIDSFCQTTVPDVYAAGDCVDSRDLTNGFNHVLAILPNAYAQGKTAGCAMSGGKIRHEGAFPINATSFLGLPLITAGMTNVKPDVLARPDTEVIAECCGENYRKLVICGNVLTGFVLMGPEATKRAGIFTALLREKRDLATVPTDIRTASPELLMFDRAERTAKLYL